MAKYCANCLGAACDFCKWYDFNGDEDGCYTGDGLCRRWQIAADPMDNCDEFVCHCLKEGDPWYDRPARVNKPRAEAPSGQWVKTVPPDRPCPVRGAPS